ncbi:phage recombination protein Bet [Methylomonas montana]|uniref:phage recombination protein Bet n=1 Tax=Methylomonas montana TaxID=3058963 RepID=UPI002658DA42|nr:phage recombination protein Bet [Methylomonas montana]WKJ90171.1 phage recombination protein Bet [Methylomonas montana]
MSNQNRNYQPKSRDLPMPMAAQQGYGISEQSWKVLTEVTFPTAKTPEAILMALDYCKARKLDIFKKPVHIVPMWSAALGRNVETVWPSIMEIQTTASRTGVWAGMDRPVWGPDVTKTFTGRYKDDNEQWQESSVTLTFPEWVAVTVYRIVGGKRCAFTEEVYWLEAYSTAGGKNSQVPTAMWIKRPKGQLSKCGKAASLRTAFPEECGYAAEEMDGKTLDDIADGSVIDGSATVLNAAEVGSDDHVFGGDSDVDANRVIDLSQIHPKVQKAVAELVRRTTAAGAWKAAYDYANQKFKGLDLTFALAELDKVSEVEPRATQALGQTEGTVMPPLTPKDMAMTQARQALGANR